MRPEIPQTKDSQIFIIDGVKVGVFGLITDKTPETSTIDMHGFEFDNYKVTARTQSQLLKAQGADIVILVCHVGMFCKKKVRYDDMHRAKIRRENDHSTDEDHCEEDSELYKFVS